MCANIAATQSSKSQEWETPNWLFDALNQEFNFTLDAAANKHNTKCERYYDIESDGLTHQWFRETVWINPPYQKSDAWVEYAYLGAMAGWCTCVLLVAARTDTKRWWSYIRHGEVRFLKGRLKFGLTEGVLYSAPFPSAIVIFRKDMQNRSASTLYWNIEEEK